MALTDSDASDSDAMTDEGDTGSENTNDSPGETSDKESGATESQSSDSTMEDGTHELPEHFNHDLQSPIVLNHPHQLLSNIFVISRRFGCIICIYDGCHTVVGGTKCYVHLRENHNDILVNLPNGAKTALTDAITSAKEQHTPVYENHEDIFREHHIPEPYLAEIDGFKCTRCASLHCFFAGLHKRTVSRHVLDHHVRTGELAQNNNSDIVQCNAQSIAKGVVFQLIDGNDPDNNNEDDTSVEDSLFNEMFYDAYGEYVADGIPWIESNAATRMNLVEYILHMKGIITTDEYKIVDWILMGEKNPCSSRDTCKKIGQVVKEFLTKAKGRSMGADSDWLRLIAIDSSQKAQFYPTQTDCPPVYVKVLSDLIIWLAFILKQVKKPVFVDKEDEEAVEQEIPDGCVAECTISCNTYWQGQVSSRLKMTRPMGLTSWLLLLRQQL
jgi:Orsellinic acid/F9775 biosynthesis cluster protein D